MRETGTCEVRHRRHVWQFKCDTQIPQGAYRLNDRYGSAVVFVVADNLSQPVDAAHPNAFLQVREPGFDLWTPVGVFTITEALDRGEQHLGRMVGG
jgi:hypothetical protein